MMRALGGHIVLSWVVFVDSLAKLAQFLPNGHLFMGNRYGKPIPYLSDKSKCMATIHPVLAGFSLQVFPGKSLIVFP